ncbi:protein-tyrosine phosphatase family protein [Actinocorallia longicatena]|uniref:Tyrosine specific protein phosphatases domain-containing protein n=1 Tax=Actinocorallia longicatena TaxID=111803 RepID=A0ABP6QMW4_9ACTN
MPGPIRLPLPFDDGVVLGSLRHAGQRADGFDAVVSLCRAPPTAYDNRIPVQDRLSVWLIDQPGANQHPHFVIEEAARLVKEFRQQGKRVLLHCAAGRNRTGAVAAQYACMTSSVHPFVAFDVIESVLGSE